ncbi:hypothetical protein ASPSYDRAFT_57674 [Aspergillus sydowii CBS 593.65]|uniref:G-protein coupled receptors family 2 profile 2 domain-containing protein n=1 Tax=Aspergillus sydowii CBS 593.65 TaxID=1036612 RepID=A0A1L9TLD0_9EURO|nr:uncharacterized protein ASPSYDRAFT_57674 [Aspergillus sydowii CBS 593.65]OJJ60236.1 hypothetical protein ASPSYDRAFT_57674 [Aspergillus sydowii CBS 593.65]
MASNSSLAQCPDPFIAELSIGDNGGYLAGRWCTPYAVGDETVSCCFPCPFTDWQYADGFNKDVVPWLALVVLVLMVVSALTYICLPVSDTQRHYLTSSPLMGFIFISIAFIVPLGPSDHFCHDAITPNYWLSETTCAFTGSLLHFGVWVLVIGCLFRSVHLYLQLIWDVEPGTKFRAGALICIFGGSLGMLGIALGVSGVSYQVGNMCYISYPKSVGSFWGPLLAVAFVSFVLQAFIMGYCIRGVITRGGTARFSIFKRSDTPDSLSRAVPPRHTSRKIWRILQLQWRAIAIVFLILFYVAFVATAVLQWGNRGQFTDEQLKPWVDCLVQAKGDKKACIAEAKRIGPNSATAVAALALLASCGIWGVICTARWTMILGWYDWLYDRKDNISALLSGEYHRERARDLERVASTAYSHSPTDVTSPTTLEEVDRMYGTRAYHGPQNSFSRPGAGPGTGTATGPGTTARGRASTFTGSTVTTTISSSNTFDLKEFK